MVNYTGQASTGQKPPGASLIKPVAAKVKSRLWRYRLRSMARGTEQLIVTLGTLGRGRLDGERSDRWILVEALCLCARLERQHGAITRIAIMMSETDPRVLDKALYLTSRSGRRSEG